MRWPADTRRTVAEGACMVELSDIAARLQSEIHDLADLAADSIYSELPDYVAIAREDLLESIHTNIGRAVQCLRERGAPLTDVDVEPQATTSRRMEQGLPIDAIIRAYRLNLTAIHRRFVDLARIENLPPAEALLGSNLLWEVGDWFIALAAKEYRTHVVPAEIRRSVEKSDVLRGLGDPIADAEAILRRLVALRLKPGEDYRVIMTLASDNEEWVRLVEHFGSSTRSPAIAATLDTVSIGVVARDPHEATHLGSIAAGTRVPFPRLAESLRVARRILAVIDPEAGTWNDSATVSWKMAVPGESTIATILETVYLSPLRANPGFGSVLLDSVLSYLNNSMNIRLTAQVLAVHENTLRHRLQKFETITDRHLGDLNTVVELAWLQEAIRLGDASASRQA